MNGPPPPVLVRRLRAQRWILGVLILAVIAGMLWTGRQPPLVISPETTRITSPLLPDGRPDYAAWLNGVASQGVTPENNAAAALVRLFGAATMFDDGLGPHPQKEARLLELLQITSPGGDDLYIDLAVAFDDLESFDPEQRPDIVQWLAANQGSLERFSASLQQCDRYFYPVVLSPDELLLEARLPSSAIQRVRKLLRLRSRQRLHEGNVDGAIADALALLRFGRLVSQDAWILSVLLRSGLEGSGQRALRDVLFSGQLTPARLETIQRELRSLPAPRTLAEIFDLGERAAALDLTCALRTSPEADTLKGGAFFNGVSDGYSIRLARGEDVNALLSQVNQDFDQIREVLQLKNAQARAAAMDRLEKSIHSLPVPSPPWPEDPIRRLLNLERPPISVTRANFPVICGEFVALHTCSYNERARMSAQLLDVGLALAAFRLKQNHYPKSLEELVPDFQPAVPPDPWSGKPLHYIAKENGFTIYSEGMNQFDERGWGQSEQGNAPRGDDIRFGLDPDLNLLLPSAENAAGGR